MIAHDIGNGQSSFGWHKQTSQLPSASTGVAPGSSCTSIFIEPVAWMEPLSIGEPNGKVRIS